MEVLTFTIALVISEQFIIKWVGRGGGEGMDSLSPATAVEYNFS